MSGFEIATATRIVFGDGASAALGTHLRGLIGRGEARLELRIEAQEFQHYHYWLYQPVVDTALGLLPASLIRDGSGPG